MLLALFSLVASEVSASLPPGPILRPARLQWYIRGAHNPVFNTYYIIWSDVGVGGKVRGMNLTSSGTDHPLDPDIVVISQATGFAVTPDIAYNSRNNQYLAVWADDRNGNADIWGQYLDGVGRRIGGNFLIFGGAFDQKYLRIAYNAFNNNYMVVWNGFARPGSRIMMQMIDGNTLSVQPLLGGMRLLDLQSENADIHSPDVAWNPVTNQFLVAWAKAIASSNSFIAGKRFDGLGNGIGNTVTLANQVDFDETLPSIAVNTLNGDYLVAFDARDMPIMNVDARIFSPALNPVTDIIHIARNFFLFEWRVHAAFNRLANQYLLTHVQHKKCGPSDCDDILARTVEPDGTRGTPFPVADTTALETHGSNDGFGTWNDLITSTNEPKLLELYQMREDGINGGLIRLEADVFRVEVSTNKSTYRARETLTSSVFVSNPGTEAEIDFYFGVILPDRQTLVYFTDMAFNFEKINVKDITTMQPILGPVDLNFPFSEVVPDFFSFPFSGAEQPGAYEMFVSAIRTGSLLDGSIDEGDIVDTFSTFFTYIP